MKLIGSQSGMSIALSENITEKVCIPFVPSPYCNPDIKEHRRIEKCKDLKNNPDYATVGTCKHKGCNGKKYYAHKVDDFNTNIQAQNQVKYIEVKRNIGKQRGHFGCGHDE